MTPLAEFTMLRLSEKRQELKFRDPSDGSLREHHFVTAAVVALQELLPDHIGAHGDDERADCSCGRPYPCRRLRAIAAIFSDHPDYDDAWDPSL